MHSEINFGVMGIYTPEIVKADGSIIRYEDVNNKIVDIGLLEIVKRPTTLLEKIAISSDTADVTVGSTNIGTIIAESATYISRTNGFDLTGMYYKCNITYEFGVGVATGNITKVGIKSSNGVFVSIAKLIDSQGNQVTIQPQPTERLRINFEFRVYINPNDTVFTGIIIGNGVTTNVTLRPMNLANNSYYNIGWGFGNLQSRYIRGDNQGYGVTTFSDSATDIRTIPNNAVWDGNINPTYTDAIQSNGIASVVATYRIGDSESQTSLGIKTIAVGFIYAAFAFVFDTPISKPSGSRRTINFSFKITIGRK